MTKPNLTFDGGYTKTQPLTEGHIRKGGTNVASQIQTRPPAPAPMRPIGGTTNTGMQNIQSTTKRD